MTDLPHWLRVLNPPTNDARRDVKIEWLRKFLRLSANDLALDALYGIDRDVEYPFPGSLGGLAELLVIGTRTAEAMGEDRQLGETAARAEWASAVKHAAEYADTLRKNVWTLGRDRAAGGEIMARATAVNRAQFDRHSIEFQPEDLLAITRSIALAAATGRRANGQ